MIQKNLKTVFINMRIKEEKEKLKNIIDGLPIENVVFLLEQLGIMQKIAYGTINPKISIHRGKVYSVKFDGFIKKTYSKDNKQALRDIIERTKKAKDTKKDQDLIFSVNFAKTGDVKSVKWFSEIRRNYQNLDIE